MTEMLSLLFNIKYLKGYKGHRGLPQWLSGKESACNVGDTGDLGLIPGLGRSPAEGNGNPFQCSCLKSPMDSGAWWATVHGIRRSRMRLGEHTHTLQLPPKNYTTGFMGYSVMGCDLVEMPVRFWFET